MSPSAKTAVLSVAASAITACVIISIQYFGFLPHPPRSSEEKIREFYETENAVHVSPHSVRKGIQSGTSKILLVDLRSTQEYEASHIVGAVNVPAYKNPDESAYDEIDRIVAGFRALPKDRETVVYCYSIPCMTGRKIGKILADHGIFVKHLGIGWNEWRYDWKSWNHELEWNSTKAEDYVVSGKEPGAFSGSKDQLLTPCSSSDTTGC